MPNRIRQFIIRHRSLKLKIIALFTLFSVIPLVIVGAFSYSKSISNYQALFSNYIEQTTEALNVKVSVLFDEAISILNLATNDKTYEFLTSRDSAALYQASKNMGFIFADTRRVKKLSSDIDNVTLVSVDGHCVSERYGYYRLTRDFHDYQTVRTILSDGRSIHFFERPEIMHDNPLDSDIMTVAAAIYRMSTNDLFGIILVDIKKTVLQTILVNTQWSANSLVTIVNGEGRPIFQINDAGFSVENLAHVLQNGKPSGNVTETIGSDKYQIVYNTLKPVPWKLVVGIPQRDILLPFYETRNAIVIVLILCIFIVLFINTQISNHFVRPITVLKKMMKQASDGDFDVQASFRGDAEISELYQSFNKMVRKIKQLLASLLQEQKNLKAIELKALQAQIKPHFLYNTLDSVVRVAESGKTDEVVDLIIALSHFYKAALSSGQEIVPMSTEISHVENYLIIMKKRYHDILDYSIDVDPAMLDAAFTKITLQPIVENAIYHGIKNVRRGGSVRIEARLAPPGKICICVKDNGIGMTDEQLRKLQERIASPYTTISDSVGLKNVNERLRLYFGPDCALDIESEYNAGTTVQITAPYIAFDESTAKAATV